MNQQQHSKDLDFDRACDVVKNRMERQPFYTPLSDALWERREKIGEGGMGVVYRVFDRRLEREAALKLLLNTGEGNAGLRLRFVREAKITARLDHPNIPPIYDAGENGEGQYFLLMRLISGETMSARIRAYHRSKSQEQCRSLLEALVRVSEAVAHAHDRKVIHRDLKPENIMIGEYGEVLVMDWGLARALHDTEADREDESLRVAFEEVEGEDGSESVGGLTQAGSVIGTPGYMPPEQADGKAVDERADVFALGAILCEVLTNSPPVQGNTSLNKIVATIKKDIRTPRQIDPTVPAELESLAARTLAVEASQRLASSAEFLSELRSFLSGQSLKSHNYSLRERLTRKVRSNATLCVSVLSLFLLFTIAIAFGVQLQDAAQKVADTRQAKVEEVREAKGRTESQQKAYEMGLAAFEELNEVLVLRYRPLGNLSQEKELIRTLNLGIDRALKKLDLALEVDRTLPALHLIRARALLKSNQYKEALRSLETTLEFDSMSGEAWRLKGRVLSELLGFEFLNQELGKEGEFESRLIEIEKCFKNGEEFSSLTKAEKAIQSILFKETWKEVAIPKANDQIRREDLLCLLAMMHVHWEENYKEADLLLSEALNRCPRLFIGLLLRGRFRRRANETLSGVFDLNLAVLLRPNEFVLRVERAIMLVELGQRKEAFRELTVAQKLDPANPKIFQNIGTFHHQGKNYVEALENYNKALELDPKYVLAIMSRAKLCGDMGDVAGGLLDCERALAIAPKDDRIYYIRSLLRIVSGDMKRALKDIDRAIELRPDHYNYYFNKAGIFKELGQRKLAMGCYEKTLELNPRFSLAYLNRGDVFRDLENVGAAFEDYKMAIRFNPTHPAAYHRLGLHFAKKREFETALEYYNSALQRQNDHFDSLYSRAVVLQLLDRNEEAIADCSKVLSVAPGDYLTLVLRGALYLTEKKLELALVDLDKAISVNARGIEAYIERGALHLSRRNYKASLRDYRRAVELDPSSPANYVNLGILQKRNNYLLKAFTSFSKALEFDSDFIPAYLERSELLTESGSMKAALKDLDTALSLSPRSLDVLAQRVRFFVGQVQLEKAEREYRKMEELSKVDPRTLTAWKALKGLRKQLKK